MDDTSVDALEDRLRRGFRTLLVATILLYALLLGLGTYMLVNATNAREDIERVAHTTHSALCVLRGDLQVRYETTKGFLDDYSGVENLAIKHARADLAQVKHTIKALAPLGC